MKKFAIATALIPLTLCADEEASFNESNITELEWKTRDSPGSYNIPQIVIDNDGHGIFLAADFLFWNIGSDGLEYAVSNQVKTNHLGDAQEITPAAKYEPGFRVSARYTSDFDEYDATAKFTFIESRNHGKYDNIKNRLLSSRTPPALIGTLSLDVDTASNDWRVDFYTLDFEIGKEYKPFECTWLSARPFIGARLYRVRNRQHIEYTRDGSEQTDSIQRRCDYRGYGPRIGLDLYYGIVKGFKLYTSGAATGAYGRHTFVYNEELTPNTPIDLSYHEGERVTRSRAVLEFGSGIQFERLWDNDSIASTLKIGWEVTHHPNIVQFSQHYDANLPLTPIRNQGDLLFSGLTVSLRIDF